MDKFHPVAVRALLAGFLLASSVAFAQSVPGSTTGYAGVSRTVDHTASEPADVTAARKAVDRGQPEAALRQLDLLSVKSPVPSGVNTVRGLSFYALGRLADADTAFASALKQNPADAEAAQMRGLVLFRLGRPAEAIPLLEGARAYTERSKADPNYVLALCYLDTRRYEDARHAFAVQYGFGTDSAQAYLLAARMLLRREYVPVAEESAKKALALNPQLPLAHALLGEIALAGQHVDIAIAEFEKERERNPLEPSVYDRLGDAYTRTGNYPAAQQSLQRAVLLEPNATGPYILLGKVMLKREDPVGALTYLERAEKMDPANFMTHSLLGQAYRAVGRTDEAARETATAQQIQAASEPRIDASRQ